MKQFHTKGRENSGKLCVLPPLLGESTCLAWRRAVGQVSKPAVSRVSNPQTLRRLPSLGTGDGSADWKSAIRQVWKPALRPKGAKQIPGASRTTLNLQHCVFNTLSASLMIVQFDWKEDLSLDDSVARGHVLRNNPIPNESISSSAIGCFDSVRDCGSLLPQRKRRMVATSARQMVFEGRLEGRGGGSLRADVHFAKPGGRRLGCGLGQ